MSIQLMTAAWKSSYASGKKMVLLALCDNANDQGECYPSISMLAEKCSMSERSIYNHIDDLERDGAICRKQRGGRSTVYMLDPCKFCTPATVAPLQPLHPADSAPLQPLHPTPATVAPPPLQRLHPTPATVAPRTIKEPSIEPNTNTPPEGVSEKVWRDFVALRKEKRAKLTETALDGIRKEAVKAGWTLEAVLVECCTRGWIGFKAAWTRDRGDPRAAPSETPYQRSMRQRFEESTGQRSAVDRGVQPITLEMQP